MNDLNYQLNIQPAIYNMLSETGNELASVYGITNDEYEHALFTWLMDKLTDRTPPWVVQELHQLQAQIERDRVIEGEAVE